MIMSRNSEYNESVFDIRLFFFVLLAIAAISFVVINAWHYLFG